MRYLAFYVTCPKSLKEFHLRWIRLIVELSVGFTLLYYVSIYITSQGGMVILETP